MRAREALGSVKGGGRTSASAVGGGWMLGEIDPVVSGAERATVAGMLRWALWFTGSATETP